MAISEQNKKFLDSLIHYYINEAASYKQNAEEFVPEIESVIDTTFGIIVGNIYSEFMQAYQKQNITATLEDIQEFNKIIKEQAPIIKRAILKETAKEDYKKESETEKQLEQS